MQIYRVRQLREDLGLTQTELAALAGVHRNTIARIEAGTSGARLPVIRRLAHALNVRPATLIHDPEAQDHSDRPTSQITTPASTSKPTRTSVGQTSE